MHDESEGAVKLNDIWRASETLREAAEVLVHHPALADGPTLEQLRAASSWAYMAWSEVGYNGKEAGQTGGEWDIPDYRRKACECKCTK